MIATIASFLEFAGIVVVIGAALYLRAAIVSLNQDLRILVRQRAEHASEIDRLEKRIEMLEDMVAGASVAALRAERPTPVGEPYPPPRQPGKGRVK